MTTGFSGPQAILLTLFSLQVQDLCRSTLSVLTALHTLGAEHALRLCISTARFEARSSWQMSDRPLFLERCATDFPESLRYGDARDVVQCEFLRLWVC